MGPRGTSLGEIFPVLALSVFSSMLGIGFILPILPLYAKGMDATGIWVGLIFVSFSISRTVLMPICGRLSDRWGRKVFICPGLLAFALVSIGYVWAAGLHELLVVRLLHGCAAGMLLPIAQAYVGDLIPRGQEGTWMGYFNAAFFLGFGFGPLMGGVLTDSFGVDATFYGMGILNLLAFFLAFCFLPETRARSGIASNPPRRARQSSVLRGLFGYRLMHAFGKGCFACFIPIFGFFWLGLTPSQVGILIALYILLIGSFQIRSGKIADHLNRKGLAVCGGLISVAFLFLIPFCRDFSQLLIVCVLGGLGGSISMPAISAMEVGEGRVYGMGSIMGLLTMAMSIGICAGPLLGGGIADIFGVESVFYFSGFAGLLGIGFFVWFTKRERAIRRWERIPPESKFAKRRGIALDF